MFGGFVYFWLFCFKVFYITTSLYIVFLMTSVYARTREREKAWKFGIYCLVGALVLALPVCAVFQTGPMVDVVVDGKEGHSHMYRHPFRFTEVRGFSFELVADYGVIGCFADGCDRSYGRFLRSLRAFASSLSFFC